MPPSPVVVEVPTSVAARPSASFAFPDSAPKLMPEMQTGVERVTGLDDAGAEHRCGLAPLPVALEGDARERARDEREVVEVRGRRRVVEKAPIT